MAETGHTAPVLTANTRRQGSRNTVPDTHLQFRRRERRFIRWHLQVLGILNVVETLSPRLFICFNEKVCDPSVLLLSSINAAKRKPEIESFNLHIPTHRQK